MICLFIKFIQRFGLRSSDWRLQRSAAVGRHASARCSQNSIPLFPVCGVTRTVLHEFEVGADRTHEASRSAAIRALTTGMLRRCRRSCQRRASPSSDPSRLWTEEEQTPQTPTISLPATTACIAMHPSLSAVSARGRLGAGPQPPDEGGHCQDTNSP
jgi:hypothetical protein